MKKIVQRLLVVGMVIVAALAGAVNRSRCAFCVYPKLLRQILYWLSTSRRTKSSPQFPSETCLVGVAVNSAGTRVYVTNHVSNTVSVIDGITQTVIGSPIPVGTQPGWGCCQPRQQHRVRGKLWQ